MQYAEVALPTKTKTRQETFTYRIPPALLVDTQIGARVYVPFHNRKLIGTIVDLKATAPKIRGSFKEITGFVDPIPLFDQRSLDFLKQTARYYGATLGQIIESATPKPAKRLAKKLDVAEAKPSGGSVDGRIYGLYTPRSMRYQYYLRLIQKAIKAKKRAQIVFVNEELTEEFAQYLAKQGIENERILPSNELTPHYEQWIRVLAGQTNVVIGTRKSIFLTPPDTSLIIVDAPSAYGYKEEQFPYYHVATVAKIKAKTLGSHLVLADAAPRLEEWKDLKEKRLVLLPSEQVEKDVILIDTSTNRGLFSARLIEYVNQTLERNGKVTFYYNRRGSGRYYRCLECETAIYCPRCDTLLTVYEEDEVINLTCSNCHYQTKPPYRCTVCNSYKLGSIGLGVNSLAKIAKEYWPDRTITSLSATTEATTGNFDILVTTSEILYAPSSLVFDTLVVFQTDQLLHGSSWKTDEEAFLTLAQLKERTRRLVLMTTNPEHLVIQAICKGSIRDLYEAELQKRTAHRYPPVSPVIRLVSSNTNLEMLQQEAKSLYEALRPIVAKDGTIFQPSPIGSGKARGKYRYQIIIKGQLTKAIINTVPTNWQLDPEPDTLT